MKKHRLKALVTLFSMILLAMILAGCNQPAPLLTPQKFVHIPGPNPIITSGAESEWDGHVVEMGDILKLNETYYLFYHGHGFEGEYNRYNIGLALSTDATGPWGKSAGNPILTAGASGEWDDSNIACPVVLEIGDTFYMWYSAMKEYPRWDIGLATAPAPEGPRTKYGQNPIMETPMMTASLMERRSNGVWIQNGLQMHRAIWMMMDTPIWRNTSRDRTQGMQRVFRKRRMKVSVHIL